MCACALGPQYSIVGCGHCRQQSESSSILPFALCSAIAHRWLLSSALWCVLAGAPPQPAGIWEAASRIYTHKSDRCMVCHYLPLIIILPLLFIPWATLAIFPAPAQEHLYRGLGRVTHAPQEEPGYWCDSCSLFVCGARIWQFNLLCFGVCIVGNVCVSLGSFCFHSDLM